MKQNNEKPVQLDLKVVANEELQKVIASELKEKKDKMQKTLEELCKQQ